MPDFFRNLFDASGFPARWAGAEWSAADGWLHIGSDVAIWAAFTAIPLVLAYITLSRRDLPFPRLVGWFFVFLLVCGTTHLVDAAMFWWPAYRFSGLVKLGAAIVSWATVLGLIRVAPGAIRLPDMTRLNEELSVEIEERIRVEASFRETERRLSTVLDSIPGLVALIDAENRFTYANETYREWFGLDPERLRGKRTEQVMRRADYEHIRPWVEMAHRGQRVSYEMDISFKDGTRHWGSAIYVPQFTATGEPAGYLALVTDITDRKRTEAALQAASRMEATATLAGGVAHDFNNLMVGVLGSASMLRPEVAGNPRCAKPLELIETSATRAATLAQQLLAYARGGNYQPRRMDLNEAVREVVKLQDPGRRGSVEIETRLAEAPWPVEADLAQMVQVVMNLSLNAVEAIQMAERPGRVLIETDGHELKTEKELAHFPALKPGRYSRVRVTDDGVGITADNLRHLFEPFFTTKFQGRGLGLAALYGIVRNHGGAVRVESEPGRGAMFEVWLPSVPAEA